jgi:hypothetical protein
MKIHKPKSCANCQETYTPTGPSSRYCSRKCKLKDRWKQERKRREDAGYTFQTPGGNYGRTGKDHWSYKNGIGVFKKTLSHQVKEEMKHCERCALDLSNAKPGFWAVHHRDHDRSHNERINLELLCKRCHQIEHDCASNLN